MASNPPGPVRRAGRAAALRLGLRRRSRVEELARIVGRRARTVVEAGCNDGADTLRLLAAFPRAEIHCFEPEPRAFERARAALRSPRVTLLPCAVSDRDGRATFHRSGGAPPGQEEALPDGWHQSGSLLAPAGHLDEHPWCTFPETLEVETRRLDSWATDTGIGVVDLIWADVQGAEAALVRGAPELLARTRYLYTEYSDDELYAGQTDLAGLRALLPGWDVVSDYRTDVLLVNQDVVRR